MESVCLSLVRYAAETPRITSLAPVFTALKWILVGRSFVLLLVGVVVALVAGVRRVKYK